MDNRLRRALAATQPRAADGSERRVYYLFAGPAVPDRPLARFTDGMDAQTALAALENIAGTSTLLSRDESPTLPRPSFWKVEYASTPRRRARGARERGIRDGASR